MLVCNILIHWLKPSFVCFRVSYQPSVSSRELQVMFKVTEVPTVVVLRPNGSVLSPNAVGDIRCRGVDCFQSWQESAELIERTFMLNEEFDNLNMRTATDPVRRLKYKTEEDKRKTRWWKLWGNPRPGNREQDGKDEDKGEGGRWRIR